MGLRFEYSAGQTLLSDEEKDGLKIKTVNTQQELNEYEQYNIEKAVAWTIGRNLKIEQILSIDFINKLHQRMYGDVWKWAGSFRKSDKNIGVHWTEISIALKYLLDDTFYWIENDVYEAEEIAIRFKHRLVSIHCFPNGNGRHSRLMADIIMEKIFNKSFFSWQQSNMVKADEIRNNYIAALKKADKGTINPLITFAKK